LGPVGGTVVRPDGITDLGAVGTVGVFAGVVGATGAVEPVCPDVVVVGVDGTEGARGVVEGTEAGATGWAGWAGFGGAVTTVADAAAGATFGLLSATGALHTLEPPKAGMEAGGEDARGAYLSLDASARLANKASSLPGSRRVSLVDSGSIAREGRLGYESPCGPNLSDGDA
jgi:hypothetical protein